MAVETRVEGFRDLGVIVKNGKMIWSLIQDLNKVVSISKRTCITFSFMKLDSVWSCCYTSPHVHFRIEGRVVVLVCSYPRSQGWACCGTDGLLSWWCGWCWFQNLGVEYWELAVRRKNCTSRQMTPPLTLLPPLILPSPRLFPLSLSLWLEAIIIYFSSFPDSTVI